MTTLHFHQYMTSPATLAEAVQNAQTALGLPAQPATLRLPLATPVRFRNGVTGVISAHSSCEAQRYQVSYLDTHYMIVRHKWTYRANFEVMDGAQMRRDAEGGR